MDGAKAMSNYKLSVELLVFKQYVENALSCAVGCSNNV